MEMSRHQSVFSLAYKLSYLLVKEHKLNSSLPELILLAKTDGQLSLILILAFFKEHSVWSK